MIIKSFFCGFSSLYITKKNIKKPQKNHSVVHLKTLYLFPFHKEREDKNMIQTLSLDSLFYGLQIDPVIMFGSSKPLKNLTSNIVLMLSKIIVCFMKTIFFYQQQIFMYTFSSVDFLQVVSNGTDCSRIGSSKTLNILIIFFLCVISIAFHIC